MATKITIPVEFQNSANSYKQLIDRLQAQLQKLKPGTSLYNSIKSQLDRAQDEIRKVDAKIDLGIASGSELNTLYTGLTRIDNLVQKISDSFSNIDIKDLIDFSDVELFSGAQLQQVQNYRREIETLSATVKKLQTMKVGDYIDEKFKDNFDAAELDTTVIEVYEKLNEQLLEARTNAEGLAEDYKQATEAAAKLATQLNMQKGDRNQQASDAAYKIVTNRKVNGETGGNLAIVKKRLIAEFNQLSESGAQWLPENQDFAKLILNKMGLSPEQIAAIVKDSYDATIKAIEAEFGKKSTDKTRAFVKTDLNTAEDILNLEGASGRFDAIRDTEDQLGRTRNAAKDYKKMKDEADKRVRTLETKVAQVSQEMDITLDDDTEVSIFNRLEALEKALSQLLEKARREKAPTGEDEGLRDKGKNLNTQGLQKGEAAIKATDDAKAFEDGMKRAIGQWFSASMIITKIREGIRQAITDIQGLDKAMTNIAVVTDMSVSELWGKIDEYMSIAQQYGVTTQGVYEVSQLYYQQGLSASEVMAATTETLKMARIAGMDYAEAADAMTVAIRAFKMEMTDAQHITDVYSKVAAVTASDTEELAIAMSKTASSAESVGSSFENTTAMLAVMIETTRESAQNLGSALKSIISRYGEMKVGLTVDSEGEEIDYNKVDTALKSVGISIKDAQGQFRNFDDVIFELSEKWDSLDKNTQRYIATIMAGNRQQSRFIALVDNWERLDEVANAAQDSEDAGLLQYAKTLDSLETKINNIKTSFQQFYMSIFNGPLISAALSGINSLIQGLNKLGTFQGILNVINIIKGLKAGLNAIVGLFGSSFSQILAQWKATQAEWLNLARQSGYERGLAEGQSYVQGLQDSQAGVNNSNNLLKNNVPQQKASWLTQRAQGDSSKNISFKKNSWNGSKWGSIISIGGSILGGVLSSAGAAEASENKKAGAWISAFGNTASWAATGASVGGPWGAIIGAVAGFASSVPALVEAYDRLNVAKEKLEKATKEAEENNLKRAQAQEQSRSLQSTIENLRKLQAARKDSAEAEQAFIDASNAAAEQFPQIVEYYDEVGNAVVDIIGETCLAEQALIEARKQAAQAALVAAATELDVANTEVEVAEVKAEQDEKSAKKIKEQAQKNMADTYSSMAQGGRSIADLYKTGGADSGLYWLPLASSTFTQLLSSQNFTNDYKYGPKIFDAAKGKEKEFIQAILDFSLMESSKYADKSEEEQLGRYAEILSTLTPEVIQRNVTAFTGGETFTLEQATNLLDLLRTDLTEDLRGQKFINNNETYESYIPNTASNQAAISKEQIEAQAAARRTAYTSATVYSQGIDPTWEANWRDVQGANDLILDLAMSAAGINADSFYTSGENIGKFKDNNAQKIFQESLNEAYALFNNLTEEQINNLNELNKQVESETISSTSYKTELENILGEGSKLIDLYFSQYSYNRIEGIQRVFEGLNSINPSYTSLLSKTSFSYDSGKNKTTFNEIPDYYAWLNTLGLEDNESQHKVYKEWATSEIEKLKQQALDTQDYLSYYLLEGPISESEKFYQAIQAEEKLVLANQGSGASAAAAKRLQMLFSLYGEIGKQLNGEGKFAGLDDAAMTELYSIINTDRGSATWADNINEWAKKYSVTLEDFETYVFENFNTRVQAIIDSNQDTIKLFEDYSSKQQSGFTFEEAEHLAQQLGGEDALVADWFTTTKEGLLVLSNFSTSLATLYNKRMQEITEYRDDVNNAITAVSDSDDLSTLFKETDSGKISSELVAALNFDTELADTVAELIATKKITTETQLITWLENYAKELGIILETETKSYSAVITADTKRQKVIDLQTSAEKAGINTNRITARDQILSKGLIGYSAEEMASIQLAYNWTEGAHFKLDTATNTYTIAKSSAESVLGNFNGGLTTLLQNAADNALSEIKNLGQLAASGEAKGEYLKVFDKVAQTGVDVETEVAAALASAVSDGDATELRNYIIQEITAETGAAPDTTEVDEAIQELVAGYKDGINDNALKFLELQEKVIKGTITAVEQEELEDIEIDSEWATTLKTIMSQEGKSTVDKYAGLIIAALNSGLEWEQIEQSIADGYKVRLAKLFHGFEAANQDTYSALENVEDAEGIYTEDLLNTISLALTAEAESKTDKTGEEIDAAIEDFWASFVIDAETGIAKLNKAGPNWDEFLKAFSDEEGKILDWFQPFIDAFDTGEAAKIVNDKVKTTDLPGQLQQSIDSMFSNYSDITLESFKEFYEKIFGENSFDALDPGIIDTYIAAIKEAQKGNLSGLKTQIDNIVSSALSEDIDLDDTAIANAYKDANQAINAQFLEYQLKNIEGTITDTEKTWLSGLTFADDSWQKELTTILAQEGTDTITKYTAMIKAAIDSKLPWDQVSGMVQDAYNQQLTLLANAAEGTSIKQTETYSAIQGIEEAVGYYSQEALAGLFTQMGAEGIDIDTSKVKEYFTWDKVAQAWVLQEGKNINDALAALFGDSAIPTEVTAAFKTSQDQKSAGDLVRADTLKKQTTQTISEMMGDLANVSLAEIEELYESVTEQEIDRAILTQYEAAIEEAKNGNYTALIDLLMGLARQAGAATEEITAAQIDGIKELQAKFFGLSAKAANGTITAIEQEELDKLIPQMSETYSSAVSAILADNTLTTAEQYAKIIELAISEGVDWTLVQEYASEAYSATLNKALYGYNAKDANTYQAVSTFKDREGRWEATDVESWLTQMGSEATLNGVEDVGFLDVLSTGFKADEFGNLIWEGIKNEEGEIVTDVRQAMALFFPNGIPAWLEPFIASLEAANKAKATNDLIDADSLQSKVNSAVSSLFTGAADATLEDIRTLYDNVKGKGSFNALATETQQEWQAALNDAAMGDLDSLNNLIKDLIANDPNIESSEIKAIYDDATAEVSSKFLELSLKKITENLTASEDQWLSNFKLDDEDGWQKTLTTALETKGATTASKYAALIAAAVDPEAALPWEKISGYVTEAYNYQLSSLSEGFVVEDLGTYDAVKNIKEAAGHYGEDVLSSLFTQMTRETGKPIDLTDFTKYFSFDKETQSWMLQTGKSISAFYEAATGGTIPEYLSKAFNASEAQRMVDSALNKEAKGDNISNTIGDLIKDASNVTLETLISLYEEVHGAGTFKDSGLLSDYQNAISLVQTGSVEALRDQLLTLVQAAKAKGYDIDVSALNAAYEDAIYSLIEGITSALKKGIEGTLSAAEYDTLIQQYGLSGNATKTSSGLQLQANDQRKLIAAMYTRAAQNRSTSGLGADVWETFSGQIGSLLDSYEAVEQEITLITERIKKFGDDPSVKDQKAEAEAYLEVLKQISEAAYLDPDNPLFNFMEQDATKGFTKNFDSYVNSIESVKTAFASLKAGEYIGYQDFYNMMDFLNNQGQWETFAEKVGMAGKDYETFVNSVVENTDKWGQVNIKGITADMEISVDAAMDAMGESMAEGLKQVARNQIKYLGGLEAMLKAMVAFEELGGVEIGLDIALEDGTVVKDLSEISENWEKIVAEGKEDAVLTVVNEVVTGISNHENGAAFMEALGLGDKTLLETFFGGQVEGSEIQLVDAFGTLVKELPNLTSGQMETLAREMRASFDDSLFGEDGSFIGDKDSWTAGLIAFFNKVSFDAIPETINSKISEEWAKKQLTELKVGNFTITMSEDDLVFSGSKEDFEANKQALIEKLEEELQLDIGDLSMDADGKLTITAPEIETEVKDLTTDFTSINDAAEGVVNTISTLQSILDTFQVSEAFKEFASLVSSMYHNSEEGDASTDLGMALTIDPTDALNIFNEFKGAYETMKVAIEGNPINVKAIGSSFNGWNVQSSASTQAQGGAETSGASVETVTKVTQIISVTYEEENEAPTVDTSQTIEYSWKLKGNVPTAPSDKTIYFGWKTNDPLEKWYTVEDPLVVNFKWNPTNVPQPAQMMWTGSMNNIHGAALADGSVGRLLSGAALAQKTLVGELGPELAVYNGEYHMLGANGAEFVNLPSDAIVFNHLQTAGILKGQMNVRGTALAEGNVHGPALASGASTALAAVQRAKSVWQGLLDSLSLAELLGSSGGGGGGSDESIEAVVQELQEWYNLSRQIADTEQRINNLLAKRANLQKSDGAAYLRSLREEQRLLSQQAATQEVLLGYQEIQLKRQAEHINDNEIWSQFLHVDENGLLQYRDGNEDNEGKGALQVLQELNQKSGEEQVAFLEQLGYSYTDVDGNVLEGSELVSKFFEELQEQIDNYDALYDTVNETEEKLQSLAESIEAVNEQILENQLELEQEIYDILVDAWEAEIEALEEQKDLIEEANDAYVEGLNKALETERDMYSQNEQIADRESLQRQLSLLRRSGGSASQIADLEAQLDGLLKEEYFNKQEQMIEDISNAGEEQVKKLEQQIRLEEESLKYQKENGILWDDVYKIMNDSSEKILAFMQGNYPEFFSKSVLQQEQMLTDWAKKVGIFTENRKYEEYQSQAQEQFWDNGAIWAQEGMDGLKSVYEGLSAEGQNTIRNQFTGTYASAILNGKEHDAAVAEASKAIKTTLEGQQGVNQAEATKKEDIPTNSPGEAAEFMYVTGTGKLNLRKEANKNSTSLGQYSPDTKVKILKKENDSWYKVEVDGKTGYMMASYLTTKKPNSDKNEEESNGSATYHQKAIVTYELDGKNATVEGKGISDSEWTAQQIALRYAKNKIPAGGVYKSVKYEAYAKGGLVDYTGPAFVHGTPSKPEAFLNAKQTAMISEAVKFAGDGGALDGIKATLAALNSSIKSIINNNTTQTSSFTVAPGAVTIQVAQLNDSYDVEELSRDVMNRMVTIASKTTNRGVNRR